MMKLADLEEVEKTRDDLERVLRSLDSAKCSETIVIGGPGSNMISITKQEDVKNGIAALEREAHDLKEYLRALGVNPG